MLKTVRSHAYWALFCIKVALVTDPAAGSGNFLTESYLCLRKLENRAILGITGGQIVMGIVRNPIKVSITQFHGIEINDFAVTVARTALWIAESQMMKQTEDIVHMQLDFLPLKTAANIVEGNALRLDWADVVEKDKLNYIMGNPPFVGARMMSASQKEDVIFVFGSKWKNVGNMDYVTCWYKKAADVMKNTDIRTALVSTNSVTQGDQVAPLWKPLMEQGVHIDFAHRTFVWDSEATLKAHVHCVIIGFSIAPNNKPKYLYYDKQKKQAGNINAYLVDGDDVIIESRKHPLCDVTEMVFGNTPIDDGNLIIEADELNSFLEKEPLARPYIRKLIGAWEFINRKERYCLWLVDCPPTQLLRMPYVLERIDAVRKMRENSKRTATNKLKDIPMLFGEIRQPKDGNYLLVPLTSSQNRKYIPIGFEPSDVIATNLVQMLPHATLYDFGILTSNVCNSWMRAVGGRLKSDYRFTITNVYNNFPWPSPTASQIREIENTAQKILDARANYPELSFAELYGERMWMFPDLNTAHQQNDRAVMEAYGLPVKTTTESSCVAHLMKLYQELTSK